MTGEQRDMQNIRSLGVRREIPHLHVLGHALPEGCHRKLLCEVEWAAHAATPNSRKRSLSGAQTLGRPAERCLYLASSHCCLLPTAKRFSPMPFIGKSV